MSKKSDESGKKGRLRWLRWSAVLLLVVGGVSAGSYWWSERVALAEDQIRQILNQSGLVDYDIAVVDVGLGGAQVASFIVGAPSDPTLRVEDIRVAYTLSGLFEQRLQSIEIGAVAVSLTVDENGLDLGPLQPLLGGTGGGGGFQTGPISVKSFSANLDLPQGPIKVGGAGVIHQEGSIYRVAPTEGCIDIDVGKLRLGAVLLDPFSTQVCATSVDGDVYWPPTSGIAFRTGAVPLFVRSDLGDTLLEAQFGYVQAEARLDQKIGLRLRTKAAGFSYPGQNLSFANADFEIVFDDLVSLVGDWRLIDGRMSDLSEVRRFAPLSIVGDGTVTADVATFDLLVSDAATFSLLASAEGTHNVVNGRGSAQVTVGPLVYSPTGLQPQMLLPIFKGLLTNVVGSMSATAGIDWRSGVVRGVAEARLDDLGFSTEAARIEGVRGDLAFDQLFPPRTAEGQRLDVGSVEAGMVLTDGVVAFRLDGSGGVVVEGASWPFAGGTITLSSGVIEPGASEQVFELAVDEVDLAAFISLLALDGASGTGIISGRIPVTIRDGDPIITGGVLTASEPGQLSYKGGGTDAVAGGQGALVFQALEDFQYTGLTLSLEGNAQDRLTLKLNLEGANPDLYDGYPFAININTEASFAELLRSATLGTNAIDLIRGKGASGQ